FCKSTKPRQYQFSFQQLASNTRALLDSLDIGKVTVMGHSMGGMLATRFALMYPDRTEQLFMVNPIRLAVLQALCVLYRSVVERYARDLTSSVETMRQYQLTTYYANTWRPEFVRWVDMQTGMFRGEGRELVAWNSALTAVVIMSQPVVYELPSIKVPVLMLIGELDNTALGKDAAP